MLSEGGRLFCRQPNPPFCGYPSVPALLPASSHLRARVSSSHLPQKMATPSLLLSGFDRVLSLKFMPTALVPVVWPHPSHWNWQSQKAVGPGRSANLPKQLFWGNGEEQRGGVPLYRSMAENTAGAQERINPGHGTPTPSSVNNSGPMLHQDEGLPCGKEDPRLSGLWLCCYGPVGGACWEACLARCLLSFTKAWASRSPFRFSSSRKIGSPLGAGYVRGRRI